MNGSQQEVLRKGVIFLGIAAVLIWALDTQSDMLTCLAILLLPMTAFFLIYGVVGIVGAFTEGKKYKSHNHDSADGNDYRDGR